MCGDDCITYLLEKVGGKEMSEIVKKFSNNLLKNNTKIYALIHAIIPETLRVTHPRFLKHSPKEIASLQLCEPLYVYSK